MFYYKKYFECPSCSAIFEDIIKRVLLAVAQSRSLHVVHEAYLCKSCLMMRVQEGTVMLKRFLWERVQPEDDDDNDDDDEE